MPSLGVRTDAAGNFGAITLGGVDKVIVGPNGITPESLAQKLTLGTAQATTSGALKDFSVPSWAKRITLQLVGVSTNGTNVPVLKLGSAGIVSAGYVSNLTQFVDAGAVVVNIATTTSIPLWILSWTVVLEAYGAVVLTNVSGNTWLVTGTVGTLGSARSTVIIGSITLSGVLDTVRLTTSTGVDTFDAGIANILYEG